MSRSRLPHPFARLLGALYDLWYLPAERAGLSELRRQTLSRAGGRVLEIGAGTGLNLSHYPQTVSELVLTDPSSPMAVNLGHRAGATSHPAEVSIAAASAERLPFDPQSFDAVVSTFVLCTVGDQAASLAEIRRVLKPGGRFLFLEHVRSEDPSLARAQDRLAPVWRVVAAGCNCNRNTLEAIQGSYEIEELVRGNLPKALPLYRPFVAGAAQPSANL